MTTTHTTTHAWDEAERAVRAAIRRLAAVDHDLRTGASGLHWRGGAADRFAARTRRRYGELDEQRESLRYLLSLMRTAGALGEENR